MPTGPHARALAAGAAACSHHRVCESLHACALAPPLCTHKANVAPFVKSSPRGGRPRRRLVPAVAVAPPPPPLVAALLPASVSGQSAPPKKSNVRPLRFDLHVATSESGFLVFVFVCRKRGAESMPFRPPSPHLLPHCVSPACRGKSRAAPLALFLLFLRLCLLLRTRGFPMVPEPLLTDQDLAAARIRPPSGDALR